MPSNTNNKKRERGDEDLQPADPLSHTKQRKAKGKKRSLLRDPARLTLAAVAVRSQITPPDWQTWLAGHPSGNAVSRLPVLPYTSV